LTNAEVANVLGVSKRTIDTYRSTILAKLGIRSRAELVRLVHQSGRAHANEPSSDVGSKGSTSLG